MAMAQSRTTNTEKNIKSKTLILPPKTKTIKDTARLKDSMLNPSKLGKPRTKSSSRRFARPGSTLIPKQRTYQKEK